MVSDSLGKKLYFCDSSLPSILPSLLLLWMDKQVVPKTMIALEVFVKGKFMTFREFLVYFHRPPLFAVLSRFATANHKGWIRTCCETSYSFSGETSSKTILGSCYWKKPIDVSFYASALSLLMMNCVITVFFNLSRNIVALQAVSWNTLGSLRSYYGDAEDNVD